MTENPQGNHKVGELIGTRAVFQFQFQDEDGNWLTLDSSKADRDVVTRSQASGLRKNPKERQRILTHVIETYVDEIVGDGEGETSPDAVLARNEEITQRLLEQEKNSSSGQ